MSAHKNSKLHNNKLSTCRALSYNLVLSPFVSCSAVGIRLAEHRATQAHLRLTGRFVWATLSLSACNPRTRSPDDVAQTIMATWVREHVQDA